MYTPFTKCVTPLTTEPLYIIHPQGFRKVDSDRWEFYEENFQQGRRDLLHQIHRRKPSAPPAGQVARTAIEVCTQDVKQSCHIAGHIAEILLATCCLGRSAHVQHPLGQLRLAAVESRSVCVGSVSIYATFAYSCCCEMCGREVIEETRVSLSTLTDH